MKTTIDKETAMEEAARAVLLKLDRVKVTQCMYVSMDTLNASPVRVFVECNQAELRRAMPKPVKRLVPDGEYAARMANWKETAQSESGRLMADAAMLLKSAGIKFKAVKDYGWHQLTILSLPVLT